MILCYFFIVYLLDMLSENWFYVRWLYCILISMCLKFFYEIWNVDVVEVKYLYNLLKVCFVDGSLFYDVVKLWVSFKEEFSVYVEYRFVWFIYIDNFLLCGF